MVENLTKTNLALLRHSFANYDNDKDGFLQYDDMSQAIGMACQTIGQEVDEAEIEGIMGAVKADENDCYDFTKFAFVVTLKLMDKFTEEEMINVFRYIAAGELRSNPNLSLTETEVQKAAREREVDINYKDFMNVLNKRRQ